MTPDSLRRLLADLPEPDGPHPVDAGLLGEYAFARRLHGQSLVGERYPRVEAHLRTECRRCQEQLEALRALVRREESPISPARAATSEDEARPVPTPIPEPVEIAEAISLGRAIEAERDALRAPLRPDSSAPIDTRRQSTRRRQLLLVEAALIRQRLLARGLFLDRALAALSTPGSRPPNPKARLLLDDFAAGVDDLARLTNRIGRLTADLRRLGDDPRGPARSQSEALTNRGLGLTREALAVDHRLARLQGPLSGMVS
jgi:hypothetical protein